MTNFVHNTVKGLKSLLDSNGAIKLFCSEGEVMDTLVTFPDYGAPNEEIQNFESKHHLSFPEDYTKFLTQYNGARIFDILSDGENIGGGLHLFSLEEIEEELGYVELFEGVNGIPIGHLLEECHLIIDKDRLNQGDPNYLYLFEDGLDYKPLNLNFEIFLDRYIMCQGEAFWEWSYRTAENYYKTK
ncbi:SMI1/KNR4 family protein [Bacillus sonorensis]|uniref:SMI1/KNR4 family protein n=1 Tax=Bacillus sonorensis TaxID=119858 RepID=UPI00227F1BCA|nr:SMI1/KNR4 family protein [Bacillus sonorensis]MCY8565307.1 SMI1/KNR4 family protein [Bacillus sonorensis]MEC1437198.1 SMI1/KNR4 family protein [Bacillus sonorensis]